ncbi:MAG TPA: polysaccharide biosynthesis protein, partial [Spirochaetota bacterium]|nr:polysaccharide biosynthesis protein [Spirochaetota bacterium]
MSLNLVTKLGIFIANILVGLWLVPYLIRNLGVAGYGLIPLATQLTSYIGLLSIGINGAISRYLT